MFKKLLIPVFFLFAFCFLLVPYNAYAADSHFDISVNSTYDVDQTAKTKVTQVISIKNKTEFYYTPTYTVTVGFGNVENVEAFNSDGSIPTTIDDKKEQGKSIKLSFPKRYAGLNETNTFTLRFVTNDIAKQQGQIWEITIPGIDEPDNFSSYITRISVPETFGKASIIKPQIDSEENDAIIFNKEELGKAGAYILYGDKQYYSYRLTYNISNPNLFPVRTEIALPPQTSYQNVVISNFSERPLQVTKDMDANWIAEYRLLPQQKKQIVVQGFIEVGINSLSEELTSRQLKEYSASKRFWNTKDTIIQKEIENLNTIEDIYNFVVKKLSYNYSKIANENIRLGGSGALKDPKNSVCLEFTDLFVTLARAKGIPARSVEGYAYTNNSKIRPLSLVNDILHAWPEYYDQKAKKWIMVDPTWGNTTKGMDYFKSLDFSHVVFAKKGLDSEYPIPAGGYKFNNESKDVEVKFATKEDFKKNEKVVITDSFPSFSFPKMNIQGEFTITNVGNSPLIQKIAKVKSSYGVEREFLIDYLPPGGSKTITTSFADVPFLTNGDYIITIQVDNNIHKKSVRISLIPDLSLVLTYGGLIGGSIIIAAITFHTGSILIQRRKRKNTLRRKS